MVETFAVWNAHNAFGDEHLNPQKATQAFELVKQLDSDVVVVSELMLHGVHGAANESEQLEALDEVMSAYGYIGEYTNYIPDDLPGVRDAHYMGMWTRLGTVQPSIVRYGNRFALHTFTPQGLSVSGVHFDDRYIHERSAAVRSFQQQTPDMTRAVLMGDLNDMAPSDPKSRLVRYVGKISGRIEVTDYYDSNKRVQRILGMSARIGRQAQGEAIEMLEDADDPAARMHTADPSRQPTIEQGPLKFTVDHIYGGQDVAFHDFRVHARTAETGENLSDHYPISARAELV